MNELLVGALPIAMLFTIWFACADAQGGALGGHVGRGELAAVRAAGRDLQPDHVHLLLPAARAGGRGGDRILLLRASCRASSGGAFLVLYVIGFIAYFPFRVIPD